MHVKMRSWWLLTCTMVVKNVLIAHRMCAYNPSFGLHIFVKILNMGASAENRNRVEQLG